MLQGPKGWMAPGALDTEVRSRVLDALRDRGPARLPDLRPRPFLAEQGSRRPLRRDRGPQPGHGRLLRARSAAQGGRLPAAQRSRRSPCRRWSRRSRPAWPRCGCPPTPPATSRPPIVDLDPVWACLAEAGVPFVLHVGGGKLLPKAFHNNGLPRPKDWLGRRREPARPRTSRCCTTRPSASSPAWRSTGSSSATRTCAGRPSSSARPGSPDCCATSTMRCARSPSSSRRSGSCPSCPRSTCGARCASRRSPSRTRPGCSSSAVPTSSCSRPTTRTPRAGKRPFEAFGDAVAGFDESTRERFFWRNGAELLGLA